MPRVARLDTLGLLHHVMIRGIERRRIFNDNEDRENLIERLSIKGASEKSTSKETKGRSEAESGVR